jgi:hypothetical protein
MKQCTKCKEVKELTEFAKQTSNKNGLQSKCKDCDKAYYQVNKDKIKAYKQAYYQVNKDKAKAYREENKDRKAAWNKTYYKINKDKRRAYLKAYREANRDKIKTKNQEWKEANRENIKAYREANKDKIKQKHRLYMRERKQTDDLFRLKNVLRQRTCLAFKRQGYAKNTKTQQMLGVDYEVAKAHIERQFKKGMSWSNHGEWHIDHIIPLASAKTEAELIKLCHYRNLQPLWAEENLSKHATIQESQTYLRI